MSAPRIRRQVYDLSLADLQRFPVWEFALDEEGEEGQDEATVRPYPYQYVGVLDPSWGMFVVCASFVLADGTSMWGYLTPSHDATDLGTIQPIIITPQGQVSFWCGILEPTSEGISASYGRLDKTSCSQVFPLQFASEVELLSGRLTGSIPGFLMLKEIGGRDVRVFA
ncbi:MAG: hypothetical protein WAN86_23485 [Hyphomicrobiaceae bacterium]